MSLQYDMDMFLQLDSNKDGMISLENYQMNKLATNFAIFDKNDIALES